MPITERILTVSVIGDKVGLKIDWPDGSDVPTARHGGYLARRLRQLESLPTTVLLACLDERRSELNQVLQHFDGSMTHIVAVKLVARILHTRNELTDEQFNILIGS